MSVSKAQKNLAIVRAKAALSLGVVILGSAPIAAYKLYHYAAAKCKVGYGCARAYFTQVIGQNIKDSCLLYRAKLRDRYITIVDKVNAAQDAEVQARKVELMQLRAKRTRGGELCASVCQEAVWKAQDELASKMWGEFDTKRAELAEQINVAEQAHSKAKRTLRADQDKLTAFIKNT